MLNSGKISERGSYEELSNKGGELADLAQQYHQDLDKARESGDGPFSPDEDHAALLSPASLGRQLSLDEFALSQTVSKKFDEHSSDPPSTLMTEEERKTGNVAQAIYYTYLKAAGGVFMILVHT